MISEQNIKITCIDGDVTLSINMLIGMKLTFVFVCIPFNSSIIFTLYPIRWNNKKVKYVEEGTYKA